MTKPKNKSTLPWYTLPIIWGVLFIPLLVLIGDVWRTIKPQDFVGLEALGPSVISSLISLALISIGSVVTSKTKKFQALATTLAISALIFFLQAVLTR